MQDLSADRLRVFLLCPVKPVVEASTSRLIACHPAPDPPPLCLRYKVFAGSYHLVPGRSEPC
jgi:hypothetical protein